MNHLNIVVIPNVFKYFTILIFDVSCHMTWIIFFNQGFDDCRILSSSESKFLLLNLTYHLKTVVSYGIICINSTHFLAVFTSFSFSFHFPPILFHYKNIKIHNPYIGKDASKYDLSEDVYICHKFMTCETKSSIPMPPPEKP